MDQGTPSDPARDARSRVFFRIRVGVLLTILFVVALYAVRDWRSRHRRTSWDGTLDVAVVLVHVEGTETPSPQALAAVTARSDALADRLAGEMRRHRPDAIRPFRFHVASPVTAPHAPPVPEGTGAIDLAKQSASSRRGSTRSIP